MNSHLARATFNFPAKFLIAMPHCKTASTFVLLLTLVTAQGIFAQSVGTIANSNGAAQPAVTSSQTPATMLPATSAVTATPPSATTQATPAMVMQKPQESSTQKAERSSYSSVHVDGPYIAMTFDDGPHPTLTPKLLDMLKERHIHVTFFVLGQLVKEHPEIVQRAVAEGHEIGNHSWDHKALNKLGPDGLQHEIVDTSAAVKEATGKSPAILRPPYGATSPRLSHAIEKDFGMKVILWSVDPDDWKDPGASVVESRILNGWKESAGTKPGAIILSHDIHKGTVEAMPATLDALIAKGYKFVTVSELLAMESKTPAPANAPVSATPSTPTHPVTQ